MMRIVEESTAMGGQLFDEARRLVGENLPERWRGRIDMVRGLFVKDAISQMQKLVTLLRHFREFRRVDRALFYHRYAANILLAYRLGIFDALLQGPMGPDEIARECEVEPNAARTLLQILESQELVKRQGDRFVMTPFSREFFDRKSPVSMVPMFEVCEAYARSFPDFVGAARTGKIPPLLDVFDEDGEVDALLDGVNYYIDQAARELIACADLPQIRHFIVGSMGVSFSSLILTAFPEAQVTYGCLPHLVERIPRLREHYGVFDERVVDMHGHGGEPADDQWGREAFDLVFLTKKMILDPVNGLGEKFARKAYEVLNPGGVTVFWETIHNTDEATPISRAMESFLDFGVSPGGPLLTDEGFRRTLEDIGYQEIDVVPCLDGATTFVVARK